jgi:hypothetical protein
MNEFCYSVVLFAIYSMEQVMQLESLVMCKECCQINHYAF